MNPEWNWRSGRYRFKCYIIEH